MFTWIDFLIIIVILLYGYGGYRQGFIRTTVDVIGIIVSFIVALKFYVVLGETFVSWGLNPNLAQPIGFFTLWTIVQIIFWLLSMLIFHYLPGLIHENKINKILGIFLGVLKGVMILAIFLVILMVLPFSSSFKNQLSKSAVSGALIKSTAKIGNQMEGIFGQFNTLTFTGVVQETDGNSKLDFKTDNFEIDQQGESEMVALVNKKRAKNGLQPLTADPLIRNVARAHSMDMFQKGYFAHEDPSGLTPAARMTLAHVSFRIAGENIALAPSVDLAHIGLMNSQKHRENILDPEYSRIGIGVIDAGPYGLMITQNFAD